MSRISSRAGARSTYVTGGGSASPEFRAARWNPRTCRNPASAQPSGPGPAAGIATAPTQPVVQCGAPDAEGGGGAAGIPSVRLARGEQPYALRPITWTRRLARIRRQSSPEACGTERNRLGHGARAKRPTLRQESRPLDGRPQFPDVAGPWVLSQRSDLSLRAAHRGARAPRRFPPGGLPGAWSEGRIDRIAAGAAVSAALRVPSRWRCTPVRDEL
jgi:hypothetical protein